MSGEYTEQVAELRGRAKGLPEGISRVALLEEAVRLADTHGDVDLGFQVRKDLVEATYFAGFQEKALVAFSWRLAQVDRAPEQYDLTSILWEYKWIVSASARFPQISRAQIEGLLEDVARRFETAGVNLRAVHKLRLLLALDMGDREAAQKYCALWMRTPRAWPSDCIACDQDDVVNYRLFCGKDAEAVAAARPILEGSMGCKEVPHVTLGRLLLPLVRLGMAEQAMVLHHRGYRLISGNQTFLSSIAEHLQFLAVTDNVPKAIRLFEKHLPWAVATANLKARFDFCNAVRFLLARLAEGGQSSMRVRLPDELPLAQESGGCNLADLRAWFDRESRELAGRFDARNGNDFFTRKLAEADDLARLVTPCPLRPRRPQVEAEE